MGLDALCEVVSWRTACEGARSFARTAFAELIRGWFTEEGVHLESSPTYHGWVVSTIRKLGAVERFRQPEVHGILERADAISPWLTYPDGEWVSVGDSNGTGPELTGPVEPICLGDAAGCWAIRDLTASGYAIIRSLPGVERSKSSMLFVSAMSAAIGHKHADDLGFVLMEGGRTIFVDSGKYGYNRDAARSYVTSARAHNVPSLEDGPIGCCDVDPERTRLGPIRVHEGQFIVKGEVDRPKLFRHERVFSYVPGSTLKIEDRLHNRTNSRWQSNLHLAPDLDPEITESGFVIGAGELTVHADFRGEGCELVVARGETDPYQGWVSVGYLKLTPASVVSALCPAELVESSWHITFQR